MNFCTISEKSANSKINFVSLERGYTNIPSLADVGIPKDITNPEEIRLYNTLKSPFNRLKRSFSNGEAHYFAKKLATRTEIVQYWKDVTTLPELKAVYEQIKDKDFDITNKIIQTTGQKEITFTVKENDTETKYIFVDGKLISHSRSYNTKALNRVNYDYFKRTTTLYSLGQTELNGEQKHYPKEIIQILNNEQGQPNRIIKTYTNLFNNSTNTQTFYLEDYDENFNVLDAIKKGTIKPRFETTTISFDKKTNSTTIKEIYNSSGITTTKTTTKTPNDWNMHLCIYDKNGTILYSTKKSHKKIDKNTSTTVTNGKRYLAKFNDNGSVIINGEHYSPYIRGVQDFAYLSSFFDDIPNKDVHLYNYTKSELPIDMIILMNAFCTNLEFIKNPLEAKNTGFFGGLKVPCNIGIIAHELGHTIDELAPKNETRAIAIHQNKKLMEIYKEELKNFEDKYPQITQDLTIKYFGKTGGSNKKDECAPAGLSELIAETMTIISTPGMNNKAVNTRTHYLMMHFPKTIACAANLIDEKCKSCFENINY